MDIMKKFEFRQNTIDPKDRFSARTHMDMHTRAHEFKQVIR